MNEQVRKYIISKNNKVSEKKVSLGDFLEYVKDLEVDDICSKDDLDGSNGKKIHLEEKGL